MDVLESRKGRKKKKNLQILCIFVLFSKDKSIVSRSKQFIYIYFHIDCRYFDSVKAVTSVADYERHAISKEMVKFLLVNPATSAIKAFSMTRRVIMVTSEHHEPINVLSCGYIANQQDKHR